MGGQISNPQVQDESYGHCVSNVTIVCQVVFEVFHKMPILSLGSMAKNIPKFSENKKYQSQLKYFLDIKVEKDGPLMSSLKIE